jgi:protein-S-isoprenylcysteine O-methyltransferase Ste14
LPDSAALDRLGVLVATAAFLFFVMLLPSLRVRQATGASAFVFGRGADPFQRLVGVAFAVCVGGLSLFAVLFALFGAEPLGLWRLPRAVSLTGWAVALAAFAFIKLAQREMGRSWRVGIDDRPTELVTGGLFARVRNPVFTGMLAFLLGSALVMPSPWTLIGWLDCVLLIALQARLEERHLLAVHGERYRAYAARVGRLVPGIGVLREEV